MKRQQFMEIKQLEIKDLLARLTAAKLEVADLVLDKNMKKLKDVKVISKKRHDIAQMLTIIKQKQLLGEIEKKVENEKVEKPIRKKIRKVTKKEAK